MVLVVICNQCECSYSVQYFRPKGHFFFMRPLQNVQIIIGSARDERQGERVARWLTDEIARIPAAADLSIEVIDLRDWPLPFFNEHPASGKLDDTIVGEWMRKVAEADAYIIIAPEFNHSFSATLKNALDYGYKSWRDKPIAFVGYGGDVVGGARAVEQLRLVAIELQMAPIRNAIYLPGVRGQFDERGALRNPQLAVKVGPLVEQLLWWSRALKTARRQDEAEAKSNEAATKAVTNAASQVANKTANKRVAKALATASA